jgi:hypothetical protein
MKHVKEMMLPTLTILIDLIKKPGRLPGYELFDCDYFLRYITSLTKLTVRGISGR